ncbi:hypothetical protein Htur_4096 (plasmid) [Haloterrigena turkmenica DSM 5511]|uniref:Uncharacterized protein n=1 Tax=Haloterrigena turkmenica (strain ATCC 51198 / DSM 5511 / JCM 9101 / NCIMB 13204 / VKM B-1734 / 4k) TaxID=543526 RepID=D2S0N3_HALTV|nr:hypothetical protein Htur_4096 [Haloterrigena turkmenica DSM 5511]
MKHYRYNSTYVNIEMDDLLKLSTGNSRREQLFIAIISETHLESRQE